MKEHIKTINEVLKKGEPQNTTSDHKGYTGYKPQYVVDAVNSELSGKWSLEVVNHQTYMTKNKKGEDVLNAFVTVKVTIEDSVMMAMASHQVLDDIGDAFKSAQTDAMKKAFSNFSIGNRAYHGLLETKK